MVWDRVESLTPRRDDDSILQGNRLRLRLDTCVHTSRRSFAGKKSIRCDILPGRFGGDVQHRTERHIWWTGANRKASKYIESFAHSRREIADSVSWFWERC